MRQFRGLSRTSARLTSSAHRCLKDSSPAFFKTVLATLLTVAMLLVTPTSLMAQDKVHDALAENWAGQHQCGPECQEHGKSPLDPSYYKLTSVDLTPVGFWAPVFGFFLILTIGSLLIRKRLRQLSPSK